MGAEILSPECGRRCPGCVELRGAAVIRRTCNLGVSRRRRTGCRSAAGRHGGVARMTGLNRIPGDQEDRRQNERQRSLHAEPHSQRHSSAGHRSWRRSRCCLILGTGYWEGSTRRRHGYGCNQTIPSSNRRRSERAQFLQIPGSHKPNSSSMAAIPVFLVRTVQSMQYGAAGRTT